MNSKQALEKLEDCKAHGQMTEAGFVAASDIVKQMAAYCAALRDNLSTILGVMSQEEGDDGAFSQAQSLMAMADLGGAELDYRTALEQACVDVVETFGESNTPAIRRLIRVLKESPAFFIRSDRLDQFLERAVSFLEQLPIKEIFRRYGLKQDAIRKIENILGDAILAQLEINVWVEDGELYAEIKAKDSTDEPKTASAPIEVEPDRLDLLLERAAAAGYKEIQGLVSGCIEVYQQAALKEVASHL